MIVVAMIVKVQMHSEHLVIGSLNRWPGTVSDHTQQKTMPL